MLYRKYGIFTICVYKQFLATDAFIVGSYRSQLIFACHSMELLAMDTVSGTCHGDGKYILVKSGGGTVELAEIQVIQKAEVLHRVKNAPNSVHPSYGPLTYRLEVEGMGGTLSVRPFLENGRYGEPMVGTPSLPDSAICKSFF